jgi:hypothetical protein
MRLWSALIQNSLQAKKLLLLAPEAGSADPVQSLS